MQEETRKISSSKKWYLRWYMILIYIAIIGIAMSGSSSNSPTNTVIDKKLDLNVWYRIEQKGFSIPVFEIRNESDVHWKNCSLSLNDRAYKADMSDVLTVNEFKNISTSSSGSHYVMSSKFTKEDGTIFNPYTTVPKTFCMSCKEPNYAVNCWQF